MVGSMWFPSGRARLGVIALAFALAVVFASSGRAATAGTAYGPLMSFGSADLSSFNITHGGIAVDPTTGNVLVSDPNNLMTRIYAPDPVAGATLVGGVDMSQTTVFFQSSVSVDPGTGDIYLSDNVVGGIAKSDPDASTPPTYTSDPTFSFDPSHTGTTGPPTAVDPVTHDLLVADFFGRAVERFTSDGAFKSSLTGSNTTGGQFANPVSVAVGPTGVVYVVDHDPGSERVERFDAAGHPLGALPIHGAPTSVTVDPGTGDVYVGEDFGLSRRPFLESFSATGDLRFRVRYPADVTGGADLGLAADGAGRIYSYVTTAGNAAAEVLVFAQGVQAGADAPQVSQVTTTGAHLLTSLDTGSATVTAHFEYCPVTADCESYGVADSGDPANPWITTSDQAGLSGGAVPLAEDLSGLDFNTSYRVRAYAVTGQGVETVSAESTFRTLLVAPTVQTHAASSVTSTSAVLNGTINASGGATTYHYEYGTTPDYGSRAPVSTEAVGGSGRTDRSFPRPITGLQPGTTYHFRLVATNDAGTTAGADRTFTTATAVAPARAYEQVTPTDKQHGAVTTTKGFLAAADGSGINYVMDEAASSAPSSVMAPRMTSLRGPVGWLDWKATDPPLGTQRPITTSTTLAVSGDFNHALVATDRKLTPDGTQGVANLYVKDLATGAYSLVGTSTQPGALAGIIGGNQNNTYIAGAPDFSWVVFQGLAPFLPGAAPQALYRWSASGGLSVASRLPGTDAPATGNLALMDISAGPTPLVSEDGSAMTFAVASNEVGVYRRASGVTTALSVSRDGGPTTPHAGTALGISRDGGSVLFTSDHLLAGAPAGAGDIYLYEAASDSLTYVGQLGGVGFVTAVSDDAHTIYYEDGTGTVVWRNGVSHAVTAALGNTAYASPNGRYLAWVASGDVQLYDADTNQTTCVSCRGDQPGGNAVLSPPDKFISNARPRAVLNDGTVFFGTSTRLVPADHNGVSDVYEYSDGLQTLISPGSGEYPARFADASSDGRDIFFTTAEGLVGQDEDDATDIYDARVGGGIPSQTPVVPAPCQKATCAEPTPGPIASPSSPSQSTSSSTQAKRTNQAKPRVGVQKVTFTDKAMHVSFTVSQRGRMRVTGTRVRTTVRDVSKAGTFKLVVPLSRKARSLKHSHRMFTVTAKLAFAGGWGTASKKISHTFGK